MRRLARDVERLSGMLRRLRQPVCRAVRQGGPHVIDALRPLRRQRRIHRHTRLRLEPTGIAVVSPLPCGFQGYGPRDHERDLLLQPEWQRHGLPDTPLLDGYEREDGRSALRDLEASYL